MAKPRFVYGGHDSSEDSPSHLAIDTGPPVKQHWFKSREEAMAFVETENAKLAQPESN